MIFNILSRIFSFRTSQASSETPHTSEQIIEVTDKTFSKEVIKADLPVLVDFWAPWCGPCRAMTPKVEEIAKNYAGKLKVAKLNVDKNQNTPALYAIQAIPAFLLFKNGEAVDSVVGVTNLDAFIRGQVG